MTFSDLMYWVFAAMAVLPAAMILFVQGIVRMAFLLLFSLAGFAGLYLHLGAAFLGFTQVLVYIGGILILFLFGVMLTARMDVPVRERSGASVLVPGVFAGLLILAGLIFMAGSNVWKLNPAPPSSVQLAPADRGETPLIGTKLLGTYVLPFEAVSILLLAAMVGAAYIARGTEKESEKDAGVEAPERVGN